MTAKSDFEVQVVQVGPISKHPNADTLDLVEVFGSTVIIKRGVFKTGDLAVYVPVDALVPTDRPEFAFLAKDGKTFSRIKAAKLRGIFSMGLLVPVPVVPNVKLDVGDDVSTHMGIIRYVSPDEARLEGHQQRTDAQRRARAVAKGPKMPVYGLDPLRKYHHALIPGEMVVVTEKVHGTNARYVSNGGRLWVGTHKSTRGCSRSRLEEFWERMKLKLRHLLGFTHRAHLVKDLGDVWWQVAEKYKLQERLAKRPDMVVFGEIYGRNADGKYVQTEGGRGFGYDTEGADPGLKLRVFDVYDMKLGKYLDFLDMRDFVTHLNEETFGAPDVETVPILRVDSSRLSVQWCPEVEQQVRKWADEGHSLLTTTHTGEGVVVKPLRERNDPRVGRVALKYAGEKYLLIRGGK